MVKQSTRLNLRRLAADPAAFRESLSFPTPAGPRRFGECMAPFQHERFAALDPALLAVAKGRRPAIGRFWWEATKGASKDSDLAVSMLWLLAFSPRPLTCQAGAADQDQADELRKAALGIVRLNGWLGGAIEVQGRTIRNRRTGSTLDIIPADVAGSHGARPDVLIVNELSHITREEFAANLLDNAAKVPHGLVIIATNAGFLDTWQWSMREMARESPRWSFHQYAQPAPWIDPAEISERRRTSSESRILRLWYGVWATGGGDALDRDLVQAAIRPHLGPMTGCEPGFCFAAGLDLAVSRDHAALVVVGKHAGHYTRTERPRPAPRGIPAIMRDLNLIDGPPPSPDIEETFHPPTGRLQLARVASWRPPTGGQIDLSAVEAAVIEAHQQYHCPVYFDPFQAALMAQRCTRVGVPMIEVAFRGTNLDAMACELLEQFNSRNIDLFDHPELMADLAALSIVERAVGHKLEAARARDGSHADRAIAFALAVLGAKRSAPTPAATIEGPLVCYP